MTTPLAPSEANFPLRSLSDWRLFLYILSPMIVTALTASGLIADSLGGLVTGLALAVLNPVLQTVNSTEKWRTYTYGVFGAINTAAITLGYWTEAAIAPWVGIITMVLSTVLASFFTSTSTDAARSVGRHAKPE